MIDLPPWIQMALSALGGTSATEAVAFFGTTPDPILDAMERKVLEWMQLRGALPSGTVS